MKRLVDQSLIDSLLVQSVTVSGESFQMFFKYTGYTYVDSHVVEVGFVNVTKGITYKGNVYIPSVNKHGLIQKNKIMWYPVHMVMPPVKFRGKSGMDSYLGGVLNPSRGAKKLSDFFPTVQSAKPLRMTPLVEMLYSKPSAEFDDINRWVVLSLDVAIIEMFNMKILSDIQRSLSPGFKGLSASIRSIHTLINAFIRYQGEDEDEIPQDEIRILEGELLGSKLSYEDKKGVLVMHDSIKTVDLEKLISSSEDRCPIDFCTGSQSKPLISGRLKDGITIKDCGFYGVPTFPYTTWRRSIPGILSDDPRRVIVSKSISRAMRLDSPETPLVVTDVELDIDSLSLPGVRITHPLTYEDGIVVSKTFAKKAGAYKVLSDRITVSKDSTIIITKSAFKGEAKDRKEYAKLAYSGEREGELINRTVRPGDSIALLTYRQLTDMCGIDGTIAIVHNTISDTIPNGCAIFKRSALTESTSYEDGKFTHEVDVYCAFSGRDRVGDVLVEQHGKIAVLDDEDFDLLTHMYRLPASIVGIVNSTEHTQGYSVQDGRIMRGSIVEEEIKTKCKVKSLVVSIDKFTAATDIRDDTVIYKIVYLSYMPLMVGDKISDAHGNKCTVSQIRDDSIMPVWSCDTDDEEPYEIQCHYMATPYIMKRLAVGAEIEDRLAICGAAVEHQLMVDSIQELPSLTSLLDGTYWEDEEIENKGKYIGEIVVDGKTCYGVPLSRRRMFRLDNNAEETITVRKGVEFDSKGNRTGRNIRLHLDLVTLQSRGAVNLSNRLIEDSRSKELVKKKIIPLLYTLQRLLPPSVKDVPFIDSCYQITRKIPNEILGNPISHARLMTYDLTGTTADPEAKTKWGIVRRQGTTAIIVPPHDPINSHRNGMIMIDNISIEANRVVAEIQSEEYVRMAPPGRKVNRTDVDGTVRRYLDYIVCVLTGKDGLIRSMTMPVFPHTARAVLTPHVCTKDSDPLKIMIPKSAFKRLMKSEKFREHYSDKKNWVCILKRDPVHREQNVIAVRFDLWNNKTIGVSPLLINSIDGDYDGDAGVAMFPVTVVGMADLEKLMPEFSEIFDPGKQLTGVNSEDAFDALSENIGWCSTFNNPHTTDIVKNELLSYKLRDVPNMLTISSEAILAAKDFETIKDGTALTGALGLQFIFSRDAENIGMLKQSMELYHVLAQNTLDAKAGTYVPAKAVVNSFNAIRHRSSEVKDLGESIEDLENKESDEFIRRRLTDLRRELKKKETDILLEAEKIHEALEELDFDNVDCIEELVDMSIKIGRQGSTKTEFYVNEAPVLGSIQQGPRPTEITEVARRLIYREPMGDGILEKLLDFLVNDNNHKLFTISMAVLSRLPEIRAKLANRD